MSESASDKPFFPIGTIALVLWALVLAMLAGCGTSRDEKSVTKEKTTLRIPQVTVETPVGPVTVKPVEVQQTRTATTEAHDETTIIPPALPAGVSDVGISLLSLVPGVGGLCAAAVAFMGRQRAMGALGAVVQGVDEFKADSADGHTVEKLHNALSRRMDSHHKQLIRKLKA